MTAVQIIQTICKPLADSPSLSNYVQMARESLNCRHFGKQFETAVAYKACHLFTMLDSESKSINGIGNGNIASYSEGGMSISFGQISGKDSELNSTRYGRMLLGLMKGIPTMNVNRNPLSNVVGGC